MNTITKCPNCGNQHLQVCIEQWADVRFDEEGSHETTDGPYGDLTWGKNSYVLCASNLEGCGWSGEMSQCETEEGEEA